MKKGSLILFALCLWLVPALAGATSYRVRPGDTLSRIAQHYRGIGWKDIYQANKAKIKNPNLIYIGQVLEIPEKIKTKKVRSNSVYIYAKPDSNPVGPDVDPGRYIAKFAIPKAVKEQFIIWAQEGGGSDADITKTNNPEAPQGKKVFSSLEAMGYGKNGRVVRNVRVAFSDLRAAKYWSLESDDGFAYHLVCDQKCFNWAWAKEKIVLSKAQAKKPKPAKQEEKIEKVAVVKAPAKIVAPAPKAKPLKPVKAQQSTVAPLKHRRVKLHPDVESWLYAGISRGVQKNSRDDRGTYIGANASFFFVDAEIGKGIFRVGPSVQATNWRGKAGNVDYSGNHRLAGLEGQYLTANTKTQLKVMLGKKTGKVDGKGFPYHADEKADLLFLEAAHQWWWDNWQNEIGARAEIASNNEKTSTWEGNPISHADDPALDQSAYAVRAKTTYTKWKNFMPTLELGAGLRKFDDAHTGQIRPGVKLWDRIVELSVHYELVEGSKNDSAGINLSVDISKLIKKTYQRIKAAKRIKQKTQNE